MTPDLRINLHYPPPLPRSLLGIMGIALLSLVASTAFFAVSYRQIAAWLRRALAVGRTDARGRHAAEEYLYTLEREFSR